MTTIRYALLIGLTLAGAVRAASADPMIVVYGEYGGLPVNPTFGPGGVDASAPVYLVENCEIALCTEVALEGTLTLAGTGFLGTVTGFAPDGTPITMYRYASGTMTWAVEWQRPDGSTVSGEFSAPIVGVHNLYTSWPEFRLTVYEYPCDPSDFCAYSYDDLELGAGMFSASLADFLEVSQQTTGGSFRFWLDEISSDVAAPREGSFNDDVLTIDAVAVVPEPPVALLAMLAMSGVLVARRI
jgi:hypothetical protein